VTTDIQATKPHLSRDHLLALLCAMVSIRRFEEKCAELYQQEKIRGFLHLYIGEEAIAVGAMVGVRRRALVEARRTSQSANLSEVSDLLTEFRVLDDMPSSWNRPETNISRPLLRSIRRAIPI